MINMTTAINAVIFLFMVSMMVIFLIDLSVRFVSGRLERKSIRSEDYDSIALWHEIKHSVRENPILIFTVFKAISVYILLAPITLTKKMWLLINQK